MNANQAAGWFNFDGKCLAVFRLTRWIAVAVLALCFLEPAVAQDPEIAALVVTKTNVRMKSLGGIVDASRELATCFIRLSDSSSYQTIFRFDPHMEPEALVPHEEVFAIADLNVLAVFAFLAE